MRNLKPPIYLGAVSFCLLIIQAVDAQEGSGAGGVQLLHISDLQPSVTSENAELAQVSPSGIVVQVTGVRLNPTLDGLEVILETPTGPLPQPITVSDRATYIADIPNAVLVLPDGNEFQIQNPADGITAVSVTQRDATTIQIRVTGLEGAPVAQVTPGESSLTLRLTVLEPDDEEVIVTAQKRPEKPQEVPISLTVLTEQQIQDAQINSLQGIAANTPNFFTTTNDRAFSFYSIRGLSNSNFLTRDAASFYIDDVPYEYVHQAFPGLLFDLERVEVLRGPQGTLYGRNSQAGVVNIISRPPTNEPEFNLEGGYGNYNQRQVQLSFSNALIPDKLAIRIAGAYNARDGFTQNTFLNEDYNSQSAFAGRANILWKPSPEWSVSFNANGALNRDGATPYVPIDQADPFKTAENTSGDYDLSINTQALRIAYDGPQVRFTSITARNFTNIGFFSDGDYSPLNLSYFDSNINSTLWSQEIRLQSPANTNRFRWLLGGYYQGREFDLAPLSTRFTAQGAAVVGLPGPAIDRLTADYDQTTYAVFGQIDFKPIERLTLTAGLRYETSRESLSRKGVLKIKGGDSSESLPPLNNEVVSDSVLLPKVGIEYRFNPRLFVYGSFSGGYRPSTQNYFAANAAQLKVKPEQSWNYEVGLKSFWLRDRLTVNIAAFWNTIDNYQVALIGRDGFFQTITNAEVDVSGVELEVSARLLEGLEIIAGFGYANSRYRDYTNPFTGKSFNGNRLLYAPDYTYNLALQYRSRRGFFGRVEMQGVGTYFFDDANTSRQNPFALVNTRIGYERKNWGIYFFVNNIFNEEYVTAAFVPFPPTELAAYGNPRTLGFQIQGTF